MANDVVGTLRALFTADTAEFESGVRKAQDTTKQLAKDFTSFGKQTKALGGLLTAGVTAPILAIGAGILSVGTDFDNALKTIRASTGATGDQLASLGDSLSTVFVGGAEGIDVVANAMAELHKRTGLAGDPLEALTRQMLDLADVTGTDVAPLIVATTRLFGDWSIATEEQSTAMDSLFKASQITGIGVDRLAETLVKFGAPLRDFGFSFEESAALLGKWEKEGVNTELVLSSLRIAAGKFAKENIPLRDGLEQVIQRIQEMGKGAEATAAAGEIFGKKAGVDMAAAITEGRFAIEKTMAAMAASGETITEADRQTETLAESWATVTNNIREALTPVGRDLVQALQDLQPFIIDSARGLADLVKWFVELDPATKQWIVIAAGVMTVLGPILVGIGGLASAIAAALPLLAALGPALTLAFGPVGLIAAALTGLVVIWAKWGDDIQRIAGELVTDLKMLLNEQLFKIFTGIQEKTKAVAQYFRDLYNSVVGHSSMSDMEEGIDDTFTRIEALMVGKAKSATDRTAKAFEQLAEQGRSWTNTLGEMLLAEAERQLAFEKSAKQIQFLGVQYAVHTEALRAAALATRDLDAAGRLLSDGMANIDLAIESTAQAARILNQGISDTPSLFERLRDIGMESIGSLNSIFQAAFTGGGGMLGAVKSFATQATEAILGMIPVIGPFLSQFAGTVVAAFSTIAGKLKDLFGGPSAKELAGREIVSEFETNIARMLTDQQRVEAGNDAWKRTVILVRDAYLALGRTEAEALRDVQALWASSKGGAEAVARAIIPIQEALDEVARRGTTAASDLTSSFADATSSISKMKDLLGEPITIRVAWDIEHPQSTRGGDVAFARSASDAQIRGAVEDFLRHNPGDEHRIGAALGLSPEQLGRAGVPGFGLGTPGLRAIDFGAGTLAMLHGPEIVLPQERVGAFVDRHGSNAALVREVSALRTDLARRDQELTRINQVLPTMVAIAVRDQLQLGSRRA